MPSSCQGGFCSLVLPNINKNIDGSGDGTNNNNSTNSSSYTSSVFNKQHAKSLSKSEKRLKRSRQRDRVIQLLRWVLTDEEYSTLEESGDLVTLRVAHYEGDNRNSNDNGSNCNNIQEGYWIDEDSIMLARREHRPELARLAFAEFQSSLGDDGFDMDGDCAAGVGSGERTNTVLEPLCCSSCSSNDGNAIVCSVCFNVYDLLRQARALLDASMQQRDDQEEEEDDEACTDAVVDAPAVIASKHQQTDNGPSKESAVDEGKSKKKKDSNTKKHIIQSSTKPSQTPKDDEQKPKKKKKKRSRRRKRNRKQMEENSKVHVLVAEADEVRILSNVSYSHSQLVSISLIVVCYLCITSDNFKTSQTSFRERRI